ncbi:MAG: relaxase/mobilization nuclease domain-containing protein [Oscillospiraceae bacterium]|nr:relaxase/mobilization nuclease domain-containing protein [Oscillospiraceae bacterium]
MAYSRVTRAKNGREAIEYAEGNGKGHNGNAHRNACISTVNMLPGVNYADQMERYWDRARVNHKTQVIRVVQSFSIKEFDPDNPADIEKANAVGRLFATKYYPGRQAIIFTQVDGKGHKTHNHIILNDVHMKTLKGCTKEQYFYKNVERWTDAATEQFVDLDFGEKTADKTTQTERVKREQGAYLWKDALRARITAAISEAETEEDFYKRLTAHGVEATRRSSKKRGEYLVYELLDFSDIPDGEAKPKHARIRSYNLGAASSPKAINAAIMEKQNISAHDLDTIPAVNSTFDGNSELECIEPETVSTYEPDLPLVSISPPTDDDDEELQRRRKRNEKRLRLIQQELRKARHAELMARFGETSHKTNAHTKNFELSL